MESDPLGPEDRAIFRDLTEVVRQELAAQIAIHRLDNADGEAMTAELIADAIWDVFEVRPRPTPLWERPAPG